MGYRTAAAEFALYGVDENGSAVPLSIVDATGAPVDLSTLTFVGNINPQLVCVSTPAGTYVVERATGVAALLTTDVIPSDVAASEPVKVDASGRFYYAFGGKLVRASLPRRASGYRIAAVAELQQLSGGDEVVRPNIQVDQRGDVLATVITQVQGQDPSPEPTPTVPPVPPAPYRAAAIVHGFEQMKVFRPDGTSQPITMYGSDAYGTWSGADGAMYTVNTPFSTLTGGVLQFGINKVVIADDGSVSFDQVVKDVSLTNISRPAMQVAGSTVITFQNKALSTQAFGSRTDGPGSTGVVVFSNGTVEKTTLTSITDEIQSDSSDTGVYVLGHAAGSTSNKAIALYNVGAKSESLAFSDHQTYDVQTFAVTGAGEVTVSAVRRSDGATVLGKVNAQGSLDVTSNLSVQQMVALD